MRALWKGKGIEGWESGELFKDTYCSFPISIRLSHGVLAERVEALRLILNFEL